LSVSEYNKRKLESKILEVKEILYSFSYPYNRRIADAHGNFKNKDYKTWLLKAKIEELARALTRLAQLNQAKIYLFWSEPDVYI
jgi:hypothetical protein